MTPEQQEIVAKLRDIHLPTSSSGAVDVVGFVVWPSIILVAIAGTIVIHAWRRRTLWRRQVRTALNDIETHATQGELTAGWEGMAYLLRRIALKFDPSAASLTGDRWLDHLDRLFGVDTFRTGVGHHLSIAPYSHEQTNTGTGPSLSVLITTIRQRLNRLGRY